MGNSKSQQFSNLLSQLKTDDWRILEQCQTHQLWQRKADGRRFMVYPINETLIDSEEKLQLYNFRKLNHGSLVAIDSILSSEEHLCSLPKNKQILVENIPLTLASFRRAFNICEAMTILSAAFAGYNTLNYVYGPLFTDEGMIGFTDQGVPKVWVNANFSTNQPSAEAVSGGQAHAFSLEEKAYCCVQRLFDTVELSLAAGYPVQFRQEAAQVSSFGEGEEFVENYCRQRGIVLDDRIALQKSNKVEPLNFRTQTHLMSQRISLNTYHIPSSVNTRALHQQGNKAEHSTYIPTQSSSQHPSIYPHSIQPITTSQVSVTQRPLLRSSINGIGNVSTRVNFVFSTAANSTQISQNKPIDKSIPIPLPNKKQENPAISAPAQPQPRIHENNDESLIMQPSHQEEKPIATPVPPSGERPHISTIQSREEIHFHLQPSNTEQNQQQQYQLMVHEVLENQSNEDQPEAQDTVNKSQQQQHAFPEINRVATTESVEEQVVDLIQSDYRHSQPFDQLKKWQQSLIKLSNKQKHNEQEKPPVRLRQYNESPDDQYLSQERDKVQIDVPVREVHLFTNQIDLQNYIRNKYKDYFIAEQAEKENTDNYIDTAKEVIDSSSYFNQNYDVYQAKEPVYELPQKPKEKKGKLQQSFEDLDQRKYTFGKIQIDPISARQQYIKAVEREASNPKKARSKKLKGSIQLNSFEDRYSRYVKNRSSNSRFYSKNISSILKPQDSIMNRQSDQIIEQSTPQRNEIANRSKQEASLTYEKLRELLWA